MSALLDRTAAIGVGLELGFTLGPEHEAHEPPEARGVPRDQVRLLVSPGEADAIHSRFDLLPTFLEPGDLIVVNTSGTVAAALDGTLDGRAVALHVSNAMPGGLWLVEVRRPAVPATEPLTLAERGVVELAGGARADLLSRFATSRRLWLATIEPGEAEAVPELLRRHGRAIRYRYVPQDWPLEAYQTAFATTPGSAEMPSASRPFTPEIVTDLVRRGIGVAPLTLHTGVSSLEGHEAPYPERFEVPAATAALVNATHRAGGHVIAIGTTVVRALETTTDAQGTTHPGSGWTELFITPATGTRAVDGLLTGWHEPEATHLLMLEAVASSSLLQRAYRAAFEAGYLWHEFGDSHLILPYRSSP
jgi:S-adenosylmethionine:tRNA ribosyltransferase-isomerase